MWLPALCKCFALLLPLLLCFARVESSYYWEMFADVRIEYTNRDSNVEVGLKYSGDFASYSRTDNVNGKLRIADDSFGCNGSTSLDANGQILLLQLTPACSDYLQSVAAEASGAVGVVFYSPSDRVSLGSKPSNARTVLTTVALVQLGDETVDTFREQLKMQLKPPPAVSISKDYRQVYETSKTFYFVVFAFCILMALSCLWFVLSYVRRCCQSARNRQRRVSRAKRNVSK